MHVIAFLTFLFLPDGDSEERPLSCFIQALPAFHFCRLPASSTSFRSLFLVTCFCQNIWILRLRATITNAVHTSSARSEEVYLMSGARILPYVDTAPCQRNVIQARAMVRHEAEYNLGGKTAYEEKRRALLELQRKNMDEYNKFRDDISVARRELFLALASQNSNPSLRKRRRSPDTMVECEVLRFEGLLTESLGLELRLQCGEGQAKECADAAVVLEALQCTQEALHATRRRTEEINALRCVEQQQFAKLLAVKERVARGRLDKTRALEKILRETERTRHRSTLLNSLE
ncbi:uncharacterized protein Tco025E_08041 [Trypanosoma conorhini]|uniref:Flagellar associated protein n=1 Tax=Trypanosoma conorhini TaxID=83891 RepID=A0A3R7NKL6_9TRYP|nr:uncharacterized protein Tco025E_08041 [Trypanosoma conorhini]RNF04033.1 hypothetical protein Tco025E_08041 [Trypanosoma conorhini]